MTDTRQKVPRIAYKPLWEAAEARRHALTEQIAALIAEKRTALNALADMERKASRYLGAAAAGWLLVIALLIARYAR